MKNAILLIVLAVIIIIGAGLLVTAENQINSQKAQIATLQKTINKNNDQIGILAKEYRSASAQIKYLLAQPTPTPEMRYIIQSQPTGSTVQALPPSLPSWKYLEWNDGKCKTATPADCPYIAPGF